MNEPIGGASWGPLILRLTLGSYFILAGWSKLADIPAFVQEVAKFQILPPQLATLYGILLPYVEIGAGALMVLGLWTTLAGILTSLMLLSFTIAFGFFPGEGRIFNKDVVLLAAAVSLLYTGAGGWSIDAFRKSG